MANEFLCFSFASEADKFLSMFENNKDVVFQLRNRHIYKVKFMELISSGGLGIEQDLNFFIFFNFLICNRLEIPQAILINNLKTFTSSWFSTTKA